jgi:hypothetical protein
MVRLTKARAAPAHRLSVLLLGVSTRRIHDVTPASGIESSRMG